MQLQSNKKVGGDFVFIVAKNNTEDFSAYSLEGKLFCLSRVRLNRTIRAFEPLAPTSVLHTVFAENMPARQHHWWVRLCRLLFAHRADENRMEAVVWRQGDFDGQFFFGGPFCSFGSHEAFDFLEDWEGDCTGCCGYEEWAVCAQTEEGAEFFGEG